jgi:hypothetical protein
MYGLTVDQIMALYKVLNLYTETYKLILFIDKAGDDDTISLLNTRVALKSNKRNPINSDIKKEWERFVLFVDNGECFPRAKKNKDSEFRETYDKFWETYNLYHGPRGQ